MTKHEIKSIFDTYNNIALDSQYRKRLYQPSCNEITDILVKYRGDDEFLNLMLEQNYEKELPDFYDLLMYASNNHIDAKKRLYDFCVNKIEEDKNNSSVILKNIKILRSADIEYAQIIINYGYFIKDELSNTYLDILENCVNYLDYNKWGINEKEVGTYFINELIAYSGGRRFGSDAELNRKTVQAIKRINHSMFDEHQKGCFYNRNMILECLKEEKYNILISLISENKRKKNPVDDTALYLALYVNQIARRDKDVNDKIFSFLVANSKKESLFGETISEKEKFSVMIKKDFYIENNGIILTSIMKKSYTPSFKPLVEKLVNDEALNRKIKIKNKDGEEKEVSVGMLLKKWTKNHNGVFSYIEKWELTQSLKENSYIENESLTESLKERSANIEPIVKKRL